MQYFLPAFAPRFSLAALATALSTLAALLSPAHAATPAPKASTPLPAVVKAAVDDMRKSCREAGGRPAASPGLVQSADLNGDGRPDYVINQGAFVCDGAAALFSGSGGAEVSVLLSQPDGRWLRAFEQGAYDARLRDDGLWLAVDGSLCGQQASEAKPRSELRACWRPLQWDAARQRLDFAPLARMRPYP